MTKMLDTHAAAFACGVKPATIRKWHERGHLHRYGKPYSPAWSLDELIDLTTRRDARKWTRLLDTCHSSNVTTGTVPEDA